MFFPICKELSLPEPHPWPPASLDPQYARIVNQWVASIGLDPHKYGTHSLRQSTAAQSYKATGNLRAVQFLLGHTRLKSTIRCHSVEIKDAMQISERLEFERWEVAASF